MPLEQVWSFNKSADIIINLYLHLQCKRIYLAFLKQTKIRSARQYSSVKSIQLYQTHSTSTDKSTTQHNENFIKEVIKNKLLPNNPSRISTVTKQSIQAQDLYQYNSGYSFQQIANTVKSTKGDVLRVQNASVCCPQYTMPKSINVRQFLGPSTEPKKVEETNVLSHHKRAPLVIYNHQRSPVIDKLRKDLSSVRLSKQDLSYNPQKFLAGKLKQNTIICLENKIQSVRKNTFSI
ncbi:hypothetical protein HNY73_012267 [Argiope bruennichi]|uniref:Uncharacterized protein n=1 Tax=Argiope bruennichi TaxID=94029 RepID=A0A8T0EUD6_ARGBR|nr:hypothetical protein HNY73_012267 [Argiope bruennichi]